MNSKLLLTLAGLTVTGSLSAQTLLFSENFGTLANGTTLTTANTSFTYVRVSTGANSSLTAQNPSSIGTGASGLLLSTSGSLTGIGTSGFSPLNLGTFNFSLQLPSTQGTFFFGLGTGGFFANNNTFSSADLTAGFQITAAGQLQVRSSNTAFTSIGTPLLAGTAYDFSIVFNNSGSAVTYGGGSVANATADVYINGVLVGDDVTINAAQATANAFRIYTTGAAATGAYQVDNVALYNGAVAIPEPSTVAIGMLGLAGMMALRRRRH